MKWHLPSLSQLTIPMRENFHLRKHTPLPSTIKILETLYPLVNWNRVDFYEGLPWFTPAVAPYVTAQALPNFYSLSRFRIYLKKYDESRAQCLADIVHEAFHINQAMSFGKGYGIGFFRIWMLFYISVFFRNGYRQNPFEIPAYDQEFRFLQYCEKHNLHGIQPAVRESAFNELAQQKSLVFKKIDFKYEEGVLDLIGGFLFCVFITVVKAPADLLASIVRIILPRVRPATNVQETKRQTDTSHRQVL